MAEAPAGSAAAVVSTPPAEQQVDGPRDDEVGVNVPEWVRVHLRTICLSVLEVDYSATTRNACVVMRPLLPMLTIHCAIAPLLRSR